MRKELIEELKHLKEIKYDFKGVELIALLDELLTNIGHLDSEIRDGLIYPCLAHMFHDKLLDKELLNETTKTLLSDDFLTFDMTNEVNYSVLRRSFTLLQLVILVFVDNRDELFVEGLFDLLFDKFIDYFRKETVLTGYKEEVGWMHSVAHSADLFAQIFNSKRLKSKQAKTAMLAIRDKFIVFNYNFCNDEDERMATAIVNLLNNGVLSIDYMIEWVEGVENYDKPSSYPEVYVYKNNRKNMLRAIYFRILNEEKFSDLTEILSKKIIETESIR